MVRGLLQFTLVKCVFEAHLLVHGPLSFKQGLLTITSRALLLLDN